MKPYGFLKGTPAIFLGAPDAGDSAPFLGFIYASAESCSQSESTPVPMQVTQTVERLQTDFCEKIPAIVISFNSRILKSFGGVLIIGCSFLIGIPSGKSYIVYPVKGSLLINMALGILL